MSFTDFLHLVVLINTIGNAMLLAILIYLDVRVVKR